MKLCNALVHNILGQSQRKFPKFVQNFFQICSTTNHKSEHSKFLSDFKFDRNSVCGRGAWTELGPWLYETCTGMVHIPRQWRCFPHLCFCLGTSLDVLPPYMMLYGGAVPEHPGLSVRFYWQLIGINHWLHFEVLRSGVNGMVTCTTPATWRTGHFIYFIDLRIHIVRMNYCTG